MKRFLGAAFAAALGATALVMAPPASAHVADVCVGNGSASVSSPVYYPTVGPSASGAVASFAFSVGGCVSHGGSPLASVSLANGVLPAPAAGAWCGASSGVGGSLSGHGFSYSSAGSVLVLAGQVAGVVNAVPNALANESCVGGADVFLVSGAVYVSP